LLASDEPALVIEPLNGYRLKERKPDNIGKFRVPVGKIEKLRTGSDITVLSYGSTLRLIEEAAVRLSEMGISIEILDAQTLLPFDLAHESLESVKQTSRLLIVDEDVAGGASAYLMQQVVEKQQAFMYLDSTPRTLTGKDHRPAYGSDGDYFSKPSVEDIVEIAYQMMHEADPSRFPNPLV